MEEEQEVQILYPPEAHCEEMDPLELGVGIIHGAVLHHPTAMTPTVFGLLTTENKPVALKDISVSVHVKGIIADVTATLLCKNELQDPVEVMFIFPMDDVAAVYKFEAMIDGKTIIAEIKEKCAAYQAYDDAISSGQQGFLLEEDEMSGDIFHCTLGNLPPAQEAAVCISYVIQLFLEADQAVRFVLPAVLNPRYCPADYTGVNVTQSIPRVAPHHLPYMLHLSLQVEGVQEIQAIKSNCALTDIVYSDDLKTAAQTRLKDGHKFDRDVEILIYYLNPCLTYGLVEKGNASSPQGTIMADPSVTLCIYPDIQADHTDTYQEFIFVVDQSGSMSELVRWPSQKTKIETVKETLVLLLKSLRNGCFFNIYGFGDTFETLFQKSVKYNQTSLDFAMEKIKTFDADLGGTNIFAPLQDIFSKSLKKGYSRQVFLLTDGEVFCPAEIIEEVKKHASTHRFFTLGIGEGASTFLIKGVARASHGKYDFIIEKDRMQAKVLRCLKLAFQRSAVDISLHWKLPGGVEAVVYPKVPEVVFHQERTVIYAQLKGLESNHMEGKAEATLCYFCGTKEYRHALEFSLKPAETDSFSLHYMAAKLFIKNGLDGMKTYSNQDIIDQITKISIESNVISHYTAYIAVYKDGKEPVRGPMVSLGHNLFAYPLIRDRDYCNYREYNRHPRKATPVRRFGGCFQAFTSFSWCRRFLGHSALLDNKEDQVMALISLQMADGSWKVDKALAEIFKSTEREIKRSIPVKEVDTTLWATLLSVIWLHGHGRNVKDDWELLASKAVSWLKYEAAGIDLKEWIKAGNDFLKTEVEPRQLGI
ncbi:von Willebrand factor A domain-containing protein 5A-like [Protopterus annectens]|uniref:von Willebrand factor A domain-containing protein 5A-like n=1 Tax=Protopterus annectens TaxID=7888 RepID=UPI001CFACCA0|nr:von Willebrand factor A domain-containing protein 5A-like [Protopterus annectens]